MSVQLRQSLATVTAKATARAVLFDGGFLRIYSGAQPATADTALSGQTLLAEVGFGTPAFGPSVAGVAVAALPDVSALGTGTATWYRAVQSDGASVIEDGSVGAAGANCVLTTVLFAVGASVSIPTYTITEPKALT